MASVSFDPETKAFYVKVNEREKPVKTISLGQGKYMDISETGNVVGLEIIFPRSTPSEAFDAILKLKQDNYSEIRVLQR